uniref:Protein phosphatase 1 regulatory subunit 8 n=4 Tax=Theria TaxID=32525 RepID=G3WQA9_SARHA
MRAARGHGAHAAVSYFSSSPSLSFPASAVLFLLPVTVRRVSFRPEIGADRPRRSQAALEMSYGPLGMYRAAGPSGSQGPQPRDFDSIFNICCGHIQKISYATAQIKNLMSQLGTKQDCSKLQENLQQLQHSTNQLAKETNECLKELGSLPLPLSTSEQRLQKLQKERLMNDFSVALNNFQAVQRKVSEKEKETVARARAGSRLSAEERQREEQLVSFDSNEEWNQMQSQDDELAITEQDLELIKERETAIRQLEKLIIDEKKYYLFGRNPDLCDFTIDHQSCSRVHAALVYHKHLKRVFLIDLNSTHGTFLGHIRLEPHKPQQIPIDSTVSFGASTRAYTLREKPQTLPSAVKGDEKMGGEDDELKGLLGLPEEETELDNLTEFNTAHNKRISTLTIEEGNLDIQRPKRKRKNSRVTFSEDDEIINPEDVDPSVGRFRNMVQTAVVPVKKKRVEGPGSLSLEESVSRRMQNFPFSGGLYGGLPPTHSEAGSQSHGIHGTALIGGLPMPYPNLAPEVDLTPVVPSAVNMNPAPNPAVYNPEAVNEPKKKKYAKEAWPGKKPTPSLLI